MISSEYVERMDKVVGSGNGFSAGSPPVMILMKVNLGGYSSIRISPLREITVRGNEGPSTPYLMGRRRSRKKIKVVSESGAENE